MSGGNEENRLKQSFKEVVAAVEKAPDSDDAWESLEKLADQVEQPENIAAVYRGMLSSTLAANVKDRLIKRAVAFHEEWFGDNPKEMSALLSRVMDVDPEAQWAFERLTVVLSVAEQWDDLLKAYDKAIDAAPDSSRRKQLLDDAAQLARNFANQPDRAVDYHLKLLALDGGNRQLATSVERQLEKLERWNDLIELWRARMPELSGQDVREARIRIASCYIDCLKDPALALAELSLLMEKNPGDKEGCRGLERLLALDSASKEIRFRALDELLAAYDLAKQPKAAITALEKALDFVDPSGRPSLLREIATLASSVGDHTKAMERYAALLREAPSDADARKQLRQLSAISKRHDLRAQALVEAADACDDALQQVALLVEAASVHRDVLGSAKTATELFARALSIPELDRSTALSVAHSLNELLEAAGRSEERLEVLERLTSLERSHAVRKTIIGEAAQLAEALGDPDRALEFWNMRLAADKGDFEAMNAVVDLLEKSARFGPLVEALRKRAGSTAIPEQRLSDLMKAAEIQQSRLGDADGAIKTWLGLRDEFGELPRIMNAIDQSMAANGRMPDLAKILAESADKERLRHISLLARLGRINQEELRRPKAACRWYARALSLDPSDKIARNGLLGLTKNSDCSGEAVRELVAAFEAGDDWRSMIELLELRLANAEDDAIKARILFESARIQEKKAGDQNSALAMLARAFEFNPNDIVVEDDLLRLAQASKVWKTAADAFHAAASSKSRKLSKARAAHLLFEEGRLREIGSKELDEACRAYEAAFEIDPARDDAMAGAARVEARCGKWFDACGAAVKWAIFRNRADGEVFDSLETEAERTSAWNALAESLAGVIAKTESLPRRLRRDLEMRLGRWHMEKRKDPRAAEAAVQRALASCPDDLEALSALAGIQRSLSGPDFVKTIVRLSDFYGNDLELLREAANAALNAKLNYEEKRSVLKKLYDAASSEWVSGRQPQVKRAAERHASFACEKMVGMDIENGRKESACSLLIDAAKLPFDAKSLRSMRLRASELLVELENVPRAIDVLQTLWSENPDDLETVGRLEPLLQQQGRVPELLVVLRRQLDAEKDPKLRVAIRLRVAKLLDALEGRDERVELLEANISEEPGHPESIAALCEVLEKKNRHRTLSDLLIQQARSLMKLGKTVEAADLWSKVAVMAEQQLTDKEQAIFAYSRVVELDNRLEALDALARLHTEQGDPIKAATWLKRRLLGTKDAREKVAVLLRLARAQIESLQREKAIESLESAFKESPGNGEVRKLLIAQYRAAEAHEPLAGMLSIAVGHVADRETILSYAREAADIYKTRLGAPEKAVSILEKALPLSPEDREIRGMLAEGLLAVGRLAEARAIAEKMLEEFGRRRSAERAQVHMQLARIFHADGNDDAALEQMDLASKMDSQNISIWKTLAELARESGHAEQSEKAYRTMLLMVRRGQAEQEQGGEGGIGASEILIELSAIAVEQGMEDKAAELRESAIEALSKNDAEAPKLQELIERRGDHALLKRVLESRLANLKPGRQKAEVYVALGDLLEGPLSDKKSALDARLSALENDPLLSRTHDDALRLATELGSAARYIEKMEWMLDYTRRKSDLHARCELLLRLSAVVEKERKDLDRAWEYLNLAEAVGVREIDVWRAQAALAGARGDKQARERSLANLSRMGEEAVENETRADALFRLAEIQLSSADSMEQGIESLMQALAENPKYERSARILRRTFDAIGPDDRLLALYEKVARQVEDKRFLLDLLERKAARVEVSLEVIREGAELAVALGESDKAERLMTRAVDINRGDPQDLAKAVWAIDGLARLRKDAGDLAGAVKWLAEASDVADLDSFFGLARELAAVASSSKGDPALAAKVYEQMLKRKAAAREAWEPLAEIYVRTGDLSGIDALARDLVDKLTDVKDRNGLRMKRAKLLLKTKGREGEAVDLLKVVMREDPVDAEAPVLLADCFKRFGAEDDLIELLRAQLKSALNRRDADAVKGFALKIGPSIEKKEGAKAAAQIFRSALKLNENDPDLLAALLGALRGEPKSKERADLLERLLAGAEGDRAAELVLEAAESYASSGDEESAVRVLKAGREKAPGSAAVQKRLEKVFRDRGDHEGLAGTLTEAAGRSAETGEKVRLLKEAAEIYRGLLSNPMQAAEVMRKVVSLEPGRPEHRVDLAKALSSAGKHDKAADEITLLLDAPSTGDSLRLDLLRMRADIKAGVGDHDGALSDWEELYSRDPGGALPGLEAALKRCRSAAAGSGDGEAEKRLTLRLAEVMASAGRRDSVYELLNEWVKREPDDLDLLRRLAGMYEEDGRLKDAVWVSSRLLDLEKGEEQHRALKRFIAACEASGQLETAKAELEKVYAGQTANAKLRAELLRIYEMLGAKKEIAGLLMDEARGVADKAKRAEMMQSAGTMLLNIGEVRAALPALEDALSLRPGDVKATAALSDIHMELREPDKAQALLDKAISSFRGQRSPDLCFLLHQKAKIARRSGDHAAEIDLLKQAVTSDRSSGWVAVELADRAEELKDWDTAVWALRTISMMKEDVPMPKVQIFLRRGRVSLLKGDANRAMLFARQAEQEDPTSEEVAAFIRELEGR